MVTVLCHSGAAGDSLLPGRLAASLQQQQAAAGGAAAVSLQPVAEDAVSRGGCLLSAAELESSKLFVQDQGHEQGAAYISYQVSTATRHCGLVWGGASPPRSI